jgi:hypothetical protein
MKFFAQAARFVALAFLSSIFLSQKCPAAGGSNSNAGLAKQILADKRLDQVEAMALKLLSGFNAGTSYGEIWIRDFNTFIDGSLRVHDKESVTGRDCCANFS